MDIENIVKRLQELGDPHASAGMAKFGITPDKVFGVSMPSLRILAKEIGTDRGLAQKLWDMHYRETMILSGLIDDPNAVADEQMETMVLDFYDWEVCDQTIMNLSQKSAVAYEKAVTWCEREEEFVRRAGFVLMARLAVTDKMTQNNEFEAFFPYITKHATDDRTIVWLGDGCACAEYFKAVQGADVLFSDVSSVHGYLGRIPWRGSEEEPDCAGHIRSQHLGELATQAKVEMVVLHHEQNYSDPYDVEALVKEVKQFYDGKVVSARDGDVF